MATYNRVNVVSYGEKPASSQKYNQEIDNIYSGLNDIDSKVGKVNVGQEITGTGATTINWQNGEKVKFTFGSGNSITGESLGTGDGTTTAFSGTLSNPPVVGGSIKIYYTIGGTNYNAVDDGAGNLSGTSCSGTINYETGEWSLTFSTAPDNTTSITADYENGKETLTFTAPAHPCNLTLVVIQDGTGYRTLEYPTDVIWVDGQEPQISKNANSVSVIKFYYDNTKYYGAISLPTLEQVRAKNNQLAGDIDANNHTIKNLSSPTDNNDAVRKTDLENLSGVTDSLILNKLKNVDGDGSGLDADLLDNKQADDFLTRNADYDSDWFAISTSGTYTLTHNLGVLPLKMQVWVKSDGANNGSDLYDNNPKMAGILSIFSSNTTAFHGTVVESVTNTTITLKTGDTHVWYGATNYDTFSTGYARVLAWK